MEELLDILEEFPDISKMITKVEKFQAEVMQEYHRTHAVDNVRKQMPCFFTDGLSYTNFRNIAEQQAKKLKKAARITDVTVRGAVIYCTVKSNSGLSTWEFSVDFNDWGHVTGTFWKHIDGDNNDSPIPDKYGLAVSGEIHQFYSQIGVKLEDLSEFVDSNKSLGTPSGLNYIQRKSFNPWRREPEPICIGYNVDQLLHEHVYPIISKLKHLGFKNIKTTSIKDVNDNSDNYLFEVEQIKINDSTHFQKTDRFAYNTPIVITYHDKQEILMPFSELAAVFKNYSEIVDMFYKAGYTNIYTCKIKDLKTGLFTKDGTVHKILVNDDDKNHIMKGHLYTYDTEFVIYYHTFK